MRLLLTILLLGGAGALAILFGTEDDAGEVAVAEAPPASKVDEELRAPAPSPAPAAPASASRLDQVREAAAAPAATGVRGAARVSGTIVVRDPDGVTHDAERGWVEFDVEGNDRRQRAEVSAGRFALEVPVGREIKPDQVRLGERLTFLFERVPTRVDGDRTLELVAGWPRGGRLLVLATETRAPLDDVTVLRCERTPDPNIVRPALDGAGVQVLAERAASPIDLPRRLFGRSVLWVGAPGRAWRQVAIDDASDGERRVLLGPAGSLGVTVVNESGGVPTGELAVRLRDAGDLGDAGGALRFETPLDLAAPYVELDGLPPGPFVVAVERDEEGADPVTWGVAAADLPANGRLEVTVALRGAAADPVASLSGRLELPPAWREGLAGSGIDRPSTLAFRLEAEGEVRGRRAARLNLGGLREVDSTRGRLVFDAGGLAPGTYTWGVIGTGHEARLELPAEGLQDVLLVVPPPTVLAVKCIDAATRRPAPAETLLWRPVVAVGESDAIGGTEVVRGSTDSTFEFLVPPGLVLLHAMPSETHGLATRTIQVGRGTRQEVTLELPPVRELTVRLRDGETSVPIDGSIVVRVERAEGGGRPSVSSTDGVAMSYYLDGDGRYVVDVGPVVGFLDPAPVEVHVEGAETELVVELTRE